MNSMIVLAPRQQLAEITGKSKTLREILLALGYEARSGGGWRTLRKRLDREQIDYSHITTGRGANRGRSYYIPPPVPLEALLVENCQHTRGVLRRAILRHGLLSHKCAICGLGPEWNNKPLTLTLDHINGVNNDNRIENLRFVCPNCDTQTDTYGAKNQRRRCSKCGRPITYMSKTGRCSRCCHPQGGSPAKDVLAKLVWEKPTTTIAADYGVSDAAVAKWCKKYGITKPQPGYWRKLETNKL